MRHTGFTILFTFLILYSHVQNSKLISQEALIERVEISYDGKKVKAFRIMVTSIFDYDADFFFEKEMNPKNTLITT